MLLEKTQRRLCRLLFFAGCVLPTIAIAGFAVSRLRPSYSDSVLAAVGERLGATITCDSLATPRPGVYDLRGVILSQPATQREFLTCRQVRVTKVGRGGRFVAEGVAVRQPVESWLAGLLKSDLAIQGEIESLAVKESRINKAAFSLGGPETARRLRMKGPHGATLEADLSGRSGNLRINAPTLALPIGWLDSPLSPLFESSEATFSGRVAASISLDGTSRTGEASGSISFTDFKTPGLEAQSGGIDLDDFRWNRGRVEASNAKIDLREGRLSRPVVFGMCRWLTMEPFPALEKRYADPTRHPWFDFTQLACEVELSPDGLTVVAGCGEYDGQPRGGAIAHAVVEHEGEALLREPAQRPLPPQRLVQAWFPDDPAELPATQAAVEMARRLPNTSARQ